MYTEAHPVHACRHAHTHTCIYSVFTLQYIHVHITTYMCTSYIHISTYNIPGAFDLHGHLGELLLDGVHGGNGLVEGLAHFGIPEERGYDMH